MLAIYRREVKSYFNSMTGYIFLAGMVLFMGIYFMVYNLTNGYAYYSYSLGSMTTILMIAVPILTMRSMSDERHSKTDQMLLTAPVSIWSIILGKYAAMMTVCLVACAIFAVCPLIIMALGSYSYPAADYSTLLCFFFLCGVYVAIGMFISSLTESQVIAAVGTFVVLLMLQYWPNLIDYLPITASASFIGGLIIWTLLSILLYRLMESKLVSLIFEAVGCVAMIITYLVNSDLFDNLLPNICKSIQVLDIFQNFYYYHLFSVKGLVYYASVIGVMLFLTVQTIEKRRWS
ncbi:MAG: ABC transporter permease [Lachnospiraceae bacterium]